MNLIYDLLATTSSLTKHTILRRASPIDLDVFKLTYGPNVYGLKFHAADICMDDLGVLADEVVHALTVVAERRLTGDAARDLIEEIADTYGDLVKLICNKSLRCGVTVNSINKAHPGLISVMTLQLAKEVPLDKVGFPCSAELKYDGVRVLITNVDGTATVRTRNNKLVSLPVTTAMLERCMPDNQVLDCEVTLATGTMADRTKVSGMINSAMKGGYIDESLLVFNVFDTMAADEFHTQACPRSYHVRREQLVDIMYTEWSPQFRIAAAAVVNSAEEANAMYTRYIDEGYEGLILKQLHAKYSFKRDKSWVKLKETKTIDLTCTGIEMGNGKFAGMIGALVCRGKTDDGLDIVVKAGSGLTDYDRGLHSAHYLGKTVELKYNAVIEDKTKPGVYSLFLPRFACVREDK